MIDMERAKHARELFNGIPLRETDSLDDVPEYDWTPRVQAYFPKPTLVNKLCSAWQAAIEDWRSW